MIKKRKISILICCTVLMLCVTVALLLLETMGKYTGRLNGYIDFNIGKFNATITPTNVSTEEGVSKFVEYSMYDFKPGMNSKELDGTLDEDTAATTKFRVSNGTNASDAAGVELEYIIRIRTSNSLPLKYTLKSVIAPSAEGETETILYHDIIETPEEIIEDLAEKRYEYRFEDPTAPATVAETEGEGSGGESDGLGDESDGSGGEGDGSGGENGGSGGETPDQYNEVKFRLPKGTAQAPIVYREHELIAEWSADAEDAKSKYMKEVEIVEIIVTVTSVDPSEDEDYVFPSDPDTDEKASGVIHMIPPADLSQIKQDYIIDLRSFVLDESGNVGDYIGAFDFTVHNGFGHGLVNRMASAAYKMKLKIPTALIEATGDDKWLFSVYRNDDPDFTSNIMRDVTPTYLLHDLKADTYAEYATRDAVPVFDEKLFMLYAVYELNIDGHNILNYMRPNTAGNYEFILDKHGYTVRANKTVEVTDEIAFLNKIQLTVETTSFTEAPAPLVPVTPPPQAGEGEGEGE